MSLFVVIGALALLAGGAALVRPELPRALLGLAPSPAATYALRIAAMMVAAFGLALAGFAIAFHRAAHPPSAATSSQGAD